jgi:hypothetical protein
MTDIRIVRMVVLFLGVFCLGSLTAMSWLIHGKTPGAELAIIAGPMGTALGALGAVLVSTRTTNEAPQPVSVTNTAADPIPVEETP